MAGVFLPPTSGVLRGVTDLRAVRVTRPPGDLVLVLVPPGAIKHKERIGYIDRVEAGGRVRERESSCCIRESERAQVKNSGLDRFLVIVACLPSSCETSLSHTHTRALTQYPPLYLSR